MTQPSLNFTEHRMSDRMQIAMHISELMPFRGPADKRQAVTAWARVVRDDLIDKLKNGS